jgi:non-homologous end joining protein Ku
VHLPEINFRNQRAMQERTTYALNIIAAMRGGLEPDIFEDMYWWHTRDIVQYAVIAATAYVRACAQRRRQPIQQFVDDLQAALQLQEE